MSPWERIRRRVNRWRGDRSPGPAVPAAPDAAPAPSTETPDPSVTAALVAALEAQERPTLTQATVRVCLIVIAAVASVYVLYLVRDVLLVVFMAGFLALALGPPVDRMARAGIPRALGIIITYLVLLAAIIGVGLLVVPPVVRGVDSLANDLPGYVDDVRQNDTVREFDQQYHITDKLKQQINTLPARLGDAASALQDVTVGAFAAATEVVSVLTITFFLLLDGRRLMELFARARGPGHEPRLRRIGEDVYRSISGYVAGNLIISICAGTVTFVTLEVLGVPFAAPLAVFMALFDLIPLVGATIAGAAIAIVTLFNDFPTATIVWLIVLIAYQQVENNVLQPVVYRRTVDVSPLITIIAVLIGATLLGVLGALLAIPVAATLQIILRDVAENRTVDGAVAAEPAALPPDPGVS